MHWLRCVLLTAVALAVLPPAHAADLADRRKALTQYKTDRWQTEQGLPLNTVQALLQTRSGYLWVGTGGGLARFDGVRFKTFESSEVPQVASRSIFGLMEDREGALWIGYSGGAARYLNGRFEAMFGDEMTASRRVWGFAQGPDGVVWAATENGLVRWHNGVATLMQETDGLPTSRLRALTFDSDGTLWIGTTGGGLVSYARGKFEVFNPANGFPHLEVRAVLADPEGGVWAATAGGGLARVVQGKVRTYTMADGLPTDQLAALARDSQGSLWIGTWGAGLTRFSEGEFTSISSAEGLAGDQIWSLAVDREDSVWIGTWVGGMNRLSSRAFVVFGTPEGLSNDNVRSVLHARNGVTWVTTAGGGLNRIEGFNITRIGKAEGLPTDEVSTVHEDRDGSLWIGTYTAGVVRLRPGGRMEAYGISRGLPGNDVRVISQDRTGTVWVGTRSSLARFTGQRFAMVQDKGAPREGVSAILEGRDGTVWFGTPGQGLVRYRDGVFETFTRKDGLVSNWVMALYEDASGSLWIGTNGEGMNRLRDGRLTAIRPASGLWDGSAQVIIEDKMGYLWMTCNRGFYRVSIAELNAFADGRAEKVTSAGFGPGDALRSTTFAGGHQPAGAADAEGHIWLPSYRGLVIVDPAHLPGSGAPPAVRIDEVEVDGKSKPAEAGVVLPKGSLPLTIRYTAMTLKDAERVRFRHLLDGLNHDWVEAGRGREASFPALPHGDYRFRVAASTDGQHWSEAPESLIITVRPYFHQTVWFIVLAVLGALLAIGALIRLRTHNLRARHAEMERLVAEKTEELRLANEHLSRLSFADALTGLANRRRFDETLEKEWRRATRFQTPLAVVIADIDCFKAYNDALGHPEGDKCLSAVADVFRQSVSRAGDLAARYGGEEFMVLIPAADREAALAFAERLRHACEARAIPHPASDVAPVVTITLGVAACTPSPEDGPASLVAEADAALYRAKQEGRNRVR
jgi:diguanylate cyclase (GGDEF)-like protein